MVDRMDRVECIGQYRCKIVLKPDTCNRAVQSKSKHPYCLNSDVVLFRFLMR